MSGVSDASERAARLVEAIRRHAGGRHVIVIRGFPDPDSLASAWAHARIASALGVACDIAHVPVISRPENRAMVNALDLPVVRIVGASELDRYAALSLVDANALEIPRRAGLTCVSIVDHHFAPGRLDAEFVDLRLHVGATSTIYAEYLFSGAREIPEAAAITAPLATALAYGIRSDTDDLLNANEDDLRAMASLAPHVDKAMLRMLSRYPIAASTMSIMHRALDTLRVDGPFGFSGVGFVPPEDRDAIGQTADFIVRREGLATVLVFGIVGDTIDGSLRTTDAAFDPAAWLRDAFGIAPGGMPYGGGRRGKGGFQIPLGPIAGAPDRRALWTVARDFVEAAVRRRLGTDLPAGSTEADSDGG